MLAFNYYFFVAGQVASVLGRKESKQPKNFLWNKSTGEEYNKRLAQKKDRSKRKAGPKGRPAQKAGAETHSLMYY